MPALSFPRRQLPRLFHNFYHFSAPPLPQVRIITSGNGSHRYIDCVPQSAGKEKALQYVRQQFGIPEHLCVAAGDSGNDILMLEGDHPAIVVGNAQPELVTWLVRQEQNGKVIYADASYADGILEGLARHSLY